MQKITFKICRIDLKHGHMPYVALGIEAPPGWVILREELDDPSTNPLHPLRTQSGYKPVPHLDAPVAGDNPSQAG
jgi:hypothetical protein